LILVRGLRKSPLIEVWADGGGSAGGIKRTVSQKKANAGELGDAGCFLCRRALSQLRKNVERESFRMPVPPGRSRK
jgi:hypothetical protein